MRSSSSRAKAKPQFEVPAETTSSGTGDVAWVYRAEEQDSPPVVAESKSVEIYPVEASSTDAYVAETYRSDDAYTAHHDNSTRTRTAHTVEVVDTPREIPADDQSIDLFGSAAISGMGVLAMGVTTVSMMAVATFSLMLAPVFIAQRLWGPR